MCSPTLTRQTAARTTSLVQVASSDICSREKDEAEFHHLHMAWVLVADRKGNPSPANVLAGRLKSMPMPNVHVQSRRFARQSAACSSRGIGVLRPGRVLLMIGGLCCCALSLLAQTSDSTMTDQRNNSWTATTDLKSDDLLPTRIPVRIIESHRQNGNRTFEEAICSKFRD